MPNLARRQNHLIIIKTYRFGLMRRTVPWPVDRVLRKVEVFLFFSPFFFQHASGPQSIVSAKKRDDVADNSHFKSHKSAPNDGSSSSSSSSTLTTITATGHHTWQQS